MVVELKTADTFVLMYKRICFLAWTSTTTLEQPPAQPHSPLYLIERHLLLADLRAVSESKQMAVGDAQEQPALGGVADALLEDRLHLHVLDVPQKAWRDGSLLDADLDWRRPGLDDAHLSKPAYREHPRKNDAFCLPVSENHRERSGRPSGGRL